MVWLPFAKFVPASDTDKLTNSLLVKKG